MTDTTNNPKNNYVGVRTRSQVRRESHEPITSPPEQNMALISEPPTATNEPEFEELDNDARYDRGDHESYRMRDRVGTAMPPMVNPDVSKMSTRKPRTTRLEIAISNHLQGKPIITTNPGDTTNPGGSGLEDKGHPQRNCKVIDPPTTAPTNEFATTVSNTEDVEQSTGDGVSNAKHTTNVEGVHIKEGEILPDGDQMNDWDELLSESKEEIAEEISLLDTLSREVRSDMTSNMAAGMHNTIPGTIDISEGRNTSPVDLTVEFAKTKKLGEDALQTTTPHPGSRSSSFWNGWQSTFDSPLSASKSVDGLSSPPQSEKKTEFMSASKSVDSRHYKNNKSFEVDELLMGVSRKLKATKKDNEELKQELVSTKEHFKKAHDTLRKDVTKEIQQSQESPSIMAILNQINQSIANLKEEFKGDISQVKNDITAVKGDIMEDIQVKLDKYAQNHLQPMLATYTATHLNPLESRIEQLETAESQLMESALKKVETVAKSRLDAFSADNAQQLKDYSNKFDATNKMWDAKVAEVDALQKDYDCKIKDFTRTMKDQKAWYGKISTAQSQVRVAKEDLIQFKNEIGTTVEEKVGFAQMQHHVEQVLEKYKSEFNTIFKKHSAKLPTISESDSGERTIKSLEKKIVAKQNDHLKKMDTLDKQTCHRQETIDNMYKDIVRICDTVKGDIMKFRSGAVQDAESTISTFAEQLIKDKITQATPASGFQSNSEDEIRNIIMSTLSNQFASQRTGIMEDKEKAIQLIDRRAENYLSQFQSILKNIRAESTSHTATGRDPNSMNGTSEPTEDSDDNNPATGDKADWISGHVRNIDKARSIAVTAYDRDRLCRHGWNIRQIFATIEEAQTWLKKDSLPPSKTTTSDQPPPAGSDSNTPTTTGGTFDAGNGTNQRTTGGTFDAGDDVNGEESKQHDNSQDGDDIDDDLQIEGWQNIDTRSRKLVTCKDDRYDVQGPYWRFRHHFTNWKDAREWLAAEESNPRNDDSNNIPIEGWINDSTNERHLVSRPTDLESMTGSHWKFAIRFQNWTEARAWLKEYSPRSDDYIYPSDGSDNDDEYAQKMQQSYHRDHYGYEYNASRGDKSYRDKSNTNWNDYTTGNWKREQALRDGFQRYDKTPINEWMQKGMNRHVRLATKEEYDESNKRHFNFSSYESPRSKRPQDSGHHDGTTPNIRPTPPLSTRTYESFDLDAATTYLMGNDGVLTLEMRHLQELEFDQPYGAWQTLSPMHSRIVKNYEAINRFGEYHRGPDSSKVLGNSANKALTSTEQGDVLDWYEDLQESLEPQGIPLTPFDEMEIRYGTVAFCIPGIGLQKYLEIGSVLGQLLTKKLLPMKENADGSELSQLLSIDKVDRNKNGWDLLHTVFRCCVTIFNPEEVELCWPSYGNSNNIYKFAERIMTVAKLSRKKGEACTDYNVTMKFLKSIKTEAGEMYAYCAHTKMEALKYLSPTSTLPSHLQIMQLAKSIHDANASAGYGSSITPTKKTQERSLYKIAINTSNFGARDKSVTTTRHDDLTVGFDSHLNEAMQGVTRESISINAIYKPNGDYTTKRKPIPKPNQGDGKRKRNSLYDPSITCHACHQVGHPATRCHALAVAIWVQQYIDNGDNKNVCDKALENWESRNKMLSKPRNESRTSSDPSPKQVLHTYCERYGFSFDKVNNEIDWLYFDDYEDEKVALQEAFGLELEEETKIES